MTDDDKRQDEQIGEIRETIDEVRKDVSAVITGLEVLSVVVQGKDGQNGLKGEVTMLKQESRDMKCPAARALLEHKKSHEKEKDGGLAAERFNKQMRNIYIGFMITIIIALIDKIPKIISAMKTM